MRRPSSVSVVITTVAVAAAMALSTTASASAAPPSAGPADRPATTTPTAATPTTATAATTRTVGPSASTASVRTLVTGDRVLVSEAAGKPAYGLVRAQTSGPGAAVRTYTAGDVTYMVPVTAMPYVGRGLDLALFDVSSTPATGTVGLRIAHRGAKPSLPGVTITADRAGVATGYYTASSAAAFGRALTTQWLADRRSGTTGTGLFTGITSISPAAGPATAPTTGTDGKFPMYTLVVKARDARGRPVDFAFGFLVNVTDGRRYAGEILVEDGEARVSVPAGTYSGLMDVFGSGPDPSIREVPFGEFTVRGPGQTFTVDARSATARPSVSVPRPVGAGTVAHTFTRSDERGTYAYGATFTLPTDLDFLVAPTPAPRLGTQSFGSSYRLEGPRGSGYSYDLSFSQSGAITADQSHVVASRDLTTVAERHDAESSNPRAVFGRVAVDPAASFIFLDLGALAVPLTRTSYVGSTSGFPWFEVEWGNILADDVSELTGTERYVPGAARSIAWRRGPLGAQVAPPGTDGLDCSACRTGNALTLAFAPFSDSSGHVGGLFASPDGSPVTHFTLTRGSQVLVDRDDTYGVLDLPVASGAAQYHATLDVDRFATGADRSPRSHTEVTFRSAAATSPGQVLPILQGRLEVPTDGQGRLATGTRTITATIGRIAGAPAAGITDAVLVVRPSGFAPAEFPLVAGGGGTYQAQVELPSFFAGSPVDLGLRATDSGGSTFEQTVSRAFVLKAPPGQTAPKATEAEIAASPYAAATPRSACAAPAAGAVRCLAQWAPGAGTQTSTADLAPAGAAAEPARGLGPADIAAAYGLDPTRGQGQTVAIVAAFDNPDVESDLAVYRRAWGLPPCTTANGCFRKVNQRGGTTPPEGDPGWGLEIALDTQAVSAACPKCRILLVEADSPSFANIGAAVDQAVAQGATIVNNSYGANEFRGMTAFAPAYQRDGVAMVVSSGDFGLQAASFPAVLGTAISVGGTTLRQVDGAWTEKAWGGAGSGCSAYVAKPAWQRDANCSMRMSSDVSAVADPRTGLAVYDTYGLGPDSGWLVVGGTSLSAPLVSGMIGLAGNARLMDSAQRIYRRTADLHDVVGGSNGFCGGDYICRAVPGYDGPTGNGSPRGVGAL